MTYFSGPECHQPHAGGRTSSQIYTERWNQIRSSFILFLVDKRDQVKRSESRKGSQMDLRKFMGKNENPAFKIAGERPDWWHIPVFPTLRILR
jgi:hypothetical protein